MFKTCLQATGWTLLKGNDLSLFFKPWSHVDEAKAAATKSLKLR